jgi:signal transduction histidine kinase
MRPGRSHPIARNFNTAHVFSASLPRTGYQPLVKEFIVAGFRFAPRALLELGKELISTDEVAIYELIKNGIDAGSKNVETEAQIVITHSTYRAAIEAIATKKDLGSILDGLIGKVIPATPVERIAQFFDPVRKHLHNKQDFRKALDETYRAHNWIEIRDSGEGMSLSKLNDVYLTVGTRSRRAANIQGGTFLGDKGVGRLSAMRLGDRLQVTTATKNDANWNVLDVDWSRFSHDVEIPLEKIRVEGRVAGRKEKKSQQGTTVRISDLSADWTAQRFSLIFQERMARMVDPFEPGRGNDILVARYNGDRLIIPSVPKKLLDSAHATMTADLLFDEDGEPFIEGLVNYKMRHKKRDISARGPEVYSLTKQTVRRRGKQGSAATDVAPLSKKALKDLGPFSVEIYWFNRLVVEAVAGLTANTQATRDEIAKWSGGPMLYRHDFRILPYGDPSDDWVELDRNAFGKSGFKLNRQQVLGRVRVNSDHIALSEQTSREGLIDSDAMFALRTITIWLLHNEMRSLINQADLAERIKRREAEKIAYEFRATEKAVFETLEQIRKTVGPTHKKIIETLGEQIALLANQCESLTSKTGKVVEEVVSEREKFVHLAGIGLMTEFIFHELDRAVSHTVGLLADASASRSKAALSSLEAQLITLQKRISAFDAMTGERRQTKSKFDLVEVVDLVLEGHESQFTRHKIKVTVNRPAGGFKIRAVKGMAIQILENLIANSVYWLKQQVEFENGFKPALKIDMDPGSKALTVEDNGPGVDPKRKETIFEPFVTSKPAGVGRGLGLYISRELAQYHDWQLYMDDTAGIYRPRRLNRFVLDMDASE